MITEIGILDVQDLIHLTNLDGNPLLISQWMRDLWFMASKALCKSILVINSLQERLSHRSWASKILSEISLPLMNAD